MAASRKTTARTESKAKTQQKARTTAKQKTTATAKAETPTKAKAGNKAKTTAAKAGGEKKPRVTARAKSTAKKPATRKSAKTKTPTKKTAKKKTPAGKSAEKKKVVGKTRTRKPKKKAADATATRRVSTEPTFTPYRVHRNEDYMNEEQKDHFRQILLNWKRQLMEEVDRTMNHMQDEAANYPDPADRASQEEEFSLELKTRDRERKLIRKIDNTLELIDQEDYGYCESCGIEIGVKRLEARPTATQCIDCKTLEEIKERQTRG